MDEKIKQVLIKSIVYSCCLTAFIIGVIGCVKWYMEPLALNNPNYLGMAFNTSLLVAICSLGILFEIQKQNIFSTLCGIVVLLLGIATSSEYLLDINFDVDNLFIQFRMPPKSTLHILMSPNAAIGFTLMGFALTFCRYHATKTFFKIFALNSLFTVWVLGLIAIVGYIFDLPTLYTWGSLNFMAIDTAISFLLLSSALFCLFYVHCGDMLKRREVKISSSCFVLLFILLILFWQSVDQHEILLHKLATVFVFLFIILLSTVLYFWEVVKQKNVHLGTDIQKLKKTEDSLREKILELNLIYKATSEVAQSDSLNDALQKCMNLICEMTHWPIGHAYIVKPEQDYLTSSNIWHIQNIKHAEQFKKTTAELTFSRGVGIPGIAWQTKKPVWMEDIHLVKSPRSHPNIHGGVGFPILLDDQVIAILEFFSHVPEKFNKELIRIFHILSIQVGHVLERKRVEKQLDHLAHYDQITELPNRNYFHEVFKRSLSKAVRSKGLLAVLFLDLDHFKNVNDSLGHHLGDMLLKEVAKLLHSVVRESDFLARLGGDEFVIIAETLNNMDEARSIAERILKAFKQPICVNDTDFKISISIGIAVYPYAGDTSEKLLQSADTAMYQAKEKGRNAYQFFTEQLNDKLERSMLIEQELRFAIERNEFHLEYQPIFDLTSNKVVSVEALLRWQNKLLNDVTPSEFIPIAEATGHIVSIGEWVLKEACKLISKWLNKFENLNLEISINCSVLQLDQQQRFINYIKQIVESYQLPSHKITLELTETGLMKQVHDAIEVLHELNHLGFSIAIDDFGSGYSSLSYLKSLPISILKIDKTFTQDLEQSLNTQEITKAIIQLAKILELDVIAEGVETETQLTILKEFGCRYAQGFYLAKPMLAEDCEKFIQSHT